MDIELTVRMKCNDCNCEWEERFESFIENFGKPRCENCGSSNVYKLK